MKKTVLLSLTGLAGYFPMQAQQSTQLMNVMQAKDPAFVNASVKTYPQATGNARIQDPTNTVFVDFEEYGWENMPSLPIGRWASSPVFVKPCIASTDTGFVYLISGADASFANTTLNTRYNTVTGTYMNMAPIPQSRTQITPLHVKGKIYVAGGYGGSFSPVATNSIYDIAANTWTTGAPMPSPVGDYAAAVYADSLIYYIGGYNGSGDVSLVQIYNVNTNTWTTGTPKTGTATAGSRMGISNNQIVHMGGYSQTLAATLSTALLGTIDLLNPTVISWTALPAYPGGPAGRHGACTAFEDNGRVYFAGGDPNGQGTSALNAVYAYNTISSIWETGPAMPVGVSNISGLAAAVRNDSLYIITMGGYSGSSVVTSNSWLNIGAAAPRPAAGNDLAVCMGNTSAISATGGTSYAWLPASSLDDATSAIPVSSATLTTTYTVTMGHTYGCPVTDSLKLTVHLLPGVIANASAMAVCAGDSVLLSGSGADSYTWTGGVTDSIYYTPAATDSYTVTGTDINGCEDTDVITVAVNTLPVVTANASVMTVCAGDSVILSGSGADTYTWTGGVTDSIFYTPAATDSYTVTGTDINGCEDTDVITVAVNTLPVVTANASAMTVCAGDSVILSGSGADTYTWTGGVSDSIYYSPAATDSYTVTGTDLNGCEDTDVITVAVNALPAVTLSLAQTSVCVDNAAIALSGESPVGGTWSGTAVSGSSFDPAVSGTGSFAILYSYTDGNNCSATASDTILVDACIGLSAVNGGAAVHVYPNPVQDRFIVQLSAVPAAPVKGEVINGLGQVIHIFTISGSSQQVDMSTAEAGVYYIRLVSGTSVTLQQLLKK
ncbi:MAG: hypothetical protein K0S33_1770 [Bacteroidetes bacterium]|jgi:N-acetylneuraminic acid mutarotase|nr:hypothetical protein [Bacteroidota bacterium]